MPFFTKLLLLVVGIIGLIGITNNTSNRPAIGPTGIVRVAQSADGHSAPVLIVTKKAVIFYGPGRARLAKARKELGKDFESIADDYTFYSNEASAYVIRQGVPRILAGQRNIIRFVLANKTSVQVNTDTLPDLWGIYLFTPSKKPLRVDIFTFEQAYNDYFSR